MNLENETWKTIKEYPDYQVSNFGKIKSLKFGKKRILKLNKDNTKYFCINLYKNGKRKYIRTYILVYETFYNDKLKLNECVHHKDENKENNYYENLEKMIIYKHLSFHNKNEKHPNFNKRYSEETKKKMSISHHNFKGENHPNHKLSSQNIYDIRKSLELKLYTPKQLSWMFDVSVKTIYSIKSEKTWNRVNI